MKKLMSMELHLFFYYACNLIKIPLRFCQWPQWSCCWFTLLQVDPITAPKCVAMKNQIHLSYMESLLLNSGYQVMMDKAIKITNRNNSLPSMESQYLEYNKVIFCHWHSLFAFVKRARQDLQIILELRFFWIAEVSLLSCTTSMFD